MKLSKQVAIAATAGFLSCGVLTAGTALALQTQATPVPPPPPVVVTESYSTVVTETTVATVQQTVPTTVIIPTTEVVRTTITAEADEPSTEQSQDEAAYTTSVVGDSRSAVTSQTDEIPSQVESPSPASSTAQGAALGGTCGYLVPEVDPRGLGTWYMELNPQQPAFGVTDGVSVWIDPELDPELCWSVLVHEYSHLLQARYYGDLDKARAQVDIEQQADCMALEQGASWVYYGCDPALVPSAKVVLSAT